MKSTRRALAVLLCVLTATAAVPYQAAARVIVGAAASGGAAGGAGGVARIEVNARFTALSPAPLIAAPLSVYPFAAIPVLPASALAATPSAIPPVQPALPVRGGSIDADQVPRDARTQLASVNEKLSAAAADGSDPSGTLNSFFTGARESAGRPDVSGAPSVPAPTALAVPLPEGKATPPTAIALEAMAIDPRAPLAQRRAAVARLAKSAGSKESLERVSAANPDGGGADYEVHRAALKELAEQGVVKSLRPVSLGHKQELLALLISDKPASAVFDYDDTLEKFREPISPAAAAGLAASADAGISTAILTDRVDAKKNDKDVTVLDSIAPMTSAQKAKLTVGSNSGARLTTFDPATGDPVVVYDAALEFTQAQAAAITAASAKTAEKFGRYEYNGAEENLSAFKWVRFLPPGTAVESVAAAASFMQAELDAAGAGVSVSGRQAADPKNPSYLTISLLDKTVGIQALRDVRGFAGPMLIVGDSFFGTRMVDADMTKAAGAGSLTLAVGGLADPRIENVFVWPSQGAEASVEILGALGTPEMNKKALGGLFIQRTIAMAAFLPTVIAHALISIPVVGAAGFGALMALGPLAAVAAGPLNGLIADRLSPRNGLMLNAALRAAMALALPAFALFGVLNFWTLLLAAVANRWLLSSVLIQEGRYIRRLAGAKNVPMVNGLAWINYLALQVVLGLILGVGQYVDQLSQFSLMWPFYLLAVANVVIIPIIWKTIPNSVPNTIKFAAVAVQAVVNFALAARAKGEVVKAFAVKYWKEAALFAASIAAYFVWQSALPISGALMYWISRTDGFKSVWAQRNLRWAMLLSALLASLVYPLQYLAFPLMALTLGGVAGKGLILGQLLGAYFFGQLIATAGQLSALSGAAKMPDVKIAFTGKTLSLERLVQGGVLVLAAVWAGVSLFPGSLVAAAAAVALGLGLLYGSSKLSARGWIKHLGVGLAAVLLPFSFWGSMPALFASVLLLGIFAGPSSVSLSSYFQTNAKDSNLGAAVGVSGSTFNAAISLGFGLLSLILGLFTPAFPAALGPIGLIFLAVGVVFFFAPKLLPGLPESSVNAKPANHL